MEDECDLPGDNDFGLLCTEDREFLYNGDGVNTSGSLNSLHFDDEDEDNMATSFGESSLGESTESKTSSSPVPGEGERPKKVRKRNALRDKMRSTAEQNAYKKLREVVPSLAALKKPTKLQTIRHTLKFIERLQDKLDNLEKQSSSGGDSSGANEKGKTA